MPPPPPLFPSGVREMTKMAEMFAAFFARACPSPCPWSWSSSPVSFFMMPPRIPSPCPCLCPGSPSAAVGRGECERQRGACADNGGFHFPMHGLRSFWFSLSKNSDWFRGGLYPILKKTGEIRGEFFFAIWRIRGEATEAYPDNPNGSAGGGAGFCSADGRVAVMMPHPERVFRVSQMSWRPAEWEGGRGMIVRGCGCFGMRGGWRGDYAALV